MRAALKLFQDFLEPHIGCWGKDHLGIEWTTEYGEPGYTCGELGILFGNWNTRENAPADMARVARIAEALGYSIEWEDEWTTCSHCNKAVRTSGDSYCWKPSYHLSEGELSCRDCIEEDPGGYGECLVGDPNTADIFNIDWSEHGFTKLDTRFETGYHPGQTDNPSEVAKSLEMAGVERFLFSLDSNGQFDTKWSTWVDTDDIVTANKCLGLS